MTATIDALLQAWGPLAVVLVMIVAFAETGLLIGFFLPGDSVLFLTGAVIASGVISTPLWVAIPAIVTAAILGNQLGYVIGRRLGPRVLTRPRSRLLTPRHIETAGDFFDRHGPRAVILARFVPVARTLVPVLAGVGDMPRRAFLGYSVAGAVGWVSVMTLAGFLLGGVPFVAAHIDVLTVGLASLSLVPAAASVLRARRGQRLYGFRLGTGGGPHSGLRDDDELSAAYPPPHAQQGSGGDRLLLGHQDLVHDGR